MSHHQSPGMLDKPLQSGREWASFTRPAALGGIETLSARFVSHRFMPHTHDAVVVGVIEAGAEGFWLRGRRIEAWAGSVVVVPPGEVHTGEAVNAQGWRYRVLYLRPDWLATEGRQPQLDFSEAAIPDAVAFAQLRQAHQALTTPGVSPLAQETLLRLALAGLVLRHARSRSRALPTDQRAVRDTRAFLDAHPETALSLGELAARVGLSPSHLARSFGAVVGLPPHTYQMTARVRLARTLLDDQINLAEVALRCGFADQSHLSRVFKRVIGVPPGAYQRSRAG